MLYHTLAAGQTARQHTFHGHVWRIEGVEGGDGVKDVEGDSKADVYGLCQADWRRPTVAITCKPLPRMGGTVDTAADNSADNKVSPRTTPLVTSSADNG